MVEDSKKDLLKSIYSDEKEKLYLKTCVVNIREAQESEDDLFGLHVYLPNLLRHFLSPSYYTIMEEHGVLDEILEKMGETRKYSREESTIEFINWIDTHQEFSDLLDEEKVLKLGNELEELESFYKDIL